MSVRTEWRNVSFLKVDFLAVNDIFYAFFLVFRIYVLSFSLSLSFVFWRIFPCLRLLCFVVFFLVCYVFFAFLVFVFSVLSYFPLSLAIVFWRISPCLCLLCFSVFLVFVFCVSSYFSCLWLSCFVVYFFVLGLVRPSLLLPLWIQCVISLSFFVFDHIFPCPCLYVFCFPCLWLLCFVVFFLVFVLGRLCFSHTGSSVSYHCQLRIQFFWPRSRSPHKKWVVRINHP